MNKKTITILTYTAGVLGLTKQWQPLYDVTWEEYQNMAAQRPGEGTAWRAVFKA